MHLSRSLLPLGHSMMTGASMAGMVRQNSAARPSPTYPRSAMRPAIPALATALPRQVDGLSDRLLTSPAAANQTTTTGLDGRAVIDRWQQRRIGEHRRGRAEQRRGTGDTA